MARKKEGTYIAFTSKEELPKGEYEEKTDKRGNKFIAVKKEPEPRFYLVKQDGGRHELIKIYRKFNGVHRRLVRSFLKKRNGDEALLRILKEEHKLPVLDR